jgi:hypothetical protein
MGEERKVYKVLVGKPEEKRPLGRPRRRSEDGIRLDFRENGWWGVDCIRLAQDRDRWPAVVNVVIRLLVLAPRSELVRYSANPLQGDKKYSLLLCILLLEVKLVG